MENKRSIFICRLFLSFIACFFIFIKAEAQTLSQAQGALRQAQGDEQAPVTLQAKIDSQSIKIGQQFQLTLQAIANDSTLQLQWAQVPDTFNHLLVVNKSKRDTLKNAGKTIYLQKYTLTSFDSGRWKIPAFNFQVITQGNAASDTLTTDSLAIRVNTVPVDTTKPFKPIKEIREVPFNLWSYWPYLLAGLIILLVLIYFIFFYKKKKKPEAEKAIPQEPPYEQAIKNLHILEDEKLWQHGEIKPYYTRLTDVLRLYIERQFKVNAMEQTSDEILENVKPVTRLNQQRNNLQYILQTADLAKFAKLQPQPEEHELCMKKAYEIIEWTRPVPEKEENTEKAKSPKPKA